MLFIRTIKVKKLLIKKDFLVFTLVIIIIILVLLITTITIIVIRNDSSVNERYSILFNFFRVIITITMRCFMT